MEEQENKETNVKSTIDAVTGLVKAVPVYQDTIQPAAKEIGESLKIVSKTINMALAPIKALVWGYEKIEDFITTKVSEKLENVPKEKIITPATEIAGPTIEALKYSGHNTELRELYANLLASAMNKDSAHKAHPGYVEIIKNMTSDEALLLQIFKPNTIFPLVDLKSRDDGGFYMEYVHFSDLKTKVNLARPDLLPTYIDNLCRLVILEIPHQVTFQDKSFYEKLEENLELNSHKLRIEESDKKFEFDRKILRLTTFGKQFVENVVNIE
ncbi:DUF4393 domain-containing protein [Marinirhabdus gelatinilytica]|uniref:Uncharacterized protein DUF4393 n=1 Tax=Marinirhabdus gelatinilytica TaxID=1703343 RepID=A0A370Q348_9FLAO|nr:DUF4393 domain-containing protein [Marinirhabdus gelatinilytica]RDK82783.1 uncharacterized protein DUF4393 [Marinirhabdus gelatinilytica]